MFTCDEVQGTLPTYINGTLQPSAQVDVERHLEACPHCEAALVVFADAPLEGRAAELVREYVAVAHEFISVLGPSPDAPVTDHAPDSKPVWGDNRLPSLMNGNPVRTVPPPIVIDSSPLASVRHRGPRLRWAEKVAAGLAACLLLGVVVHHMISRPVLASAEPDPWHALRGTSRAELVRQLPDFLALNDMCEPRQWDAVVDERVGVLPASDYSGFEILRDSKVFDMTNWVSVSPDKVQNGRISPVYMTRVQVLRRLPGHANNKRIRYKYWTEGFCVDPRKNSSRDIVREGTRFDHKAQRECKVWDVDIDVSDKPEGDVFTLVTSAIFWNGFPDKPEQWAATAVGSPSISRAEFGVILPKGRTVKSWSLWKYPSGKQEAQPENKLRGGAPPREASGILYWPIAQIDVGYTYEIQWNW